MREFIKFTMRERGISQADLARELGYSRQYIHKYIIGDVNSVELELAILEYLRNGDS